MNRNLFNYVIQIIFNLILFCSLILAITSLYHKYYPVDYRKNINQTNFIFAEAIDHMSYQQIISKLDILYNESEKIDFIKKANIIYANNIHYTWPDNINGKNLITISLFDNWILYLSSYLDTTLVKLGFQSYDTNVFKRFESFKYHRALGRGFGICSQNALGISDLLKQRYNINTLLVGLDGHVVVEIPEQDEININFVIDPSYGVTLPYSIKHAGSVLDDVLRRYEESKLFKLYPDTEEYDNKKKELVETYNSEGNIYAISFGASSYAMPYYKLNSIKYFEIIVDYLVILIPIFLILYKVAYNRKKI